MSYGIIGFSQPAKMWQPSPAIFGDSLAQEMLDEGTGFFDYKDFKTRLPQAADGASVTWLTAGSGSATAIYNTNYDSVVALKPGTTDQDDVGLATRPLGPIVPGSGQKVWFEALIALSTISADKGVFVGLVNAKALGSKLLIKATSAAKNSNQIGTTSGGQSGYGFWLHADAPTNFDAVWFNNLQAATGCTDLEATTATNSGLVLASVLTANANNPNTANLGFVPATPPGAMVAINTATVSGLTPQQLLFAQDPNTSPQTYLPNSATGASGFVKLGLRYDGQQYLYFYVNGAQVAKLAITSAMDVTSDFAGVVDMQALGTTPPSINIGWMRTAALLVP